MKRNSTTEQFIKLSILKFGVKYDYSKCVYINSKTHLIIICLIHGEFSTTPDNHFRGNGCAKCLISPTKILLEDFKIKASKKHNFEYDYSLITKELNSLHDTIKIICLKHGIFEQKAYGHLYGNKCNKCSNEISAQKRSQSQEDFIKKCNKIHNNFYDYSEVEYKNSNSKIKIKCPIHGFFMQDANNHRAGQTCPKCAKKSMAKKLSLTTEEFIEKSNLKHNYFYKYKNTIYISYYEQVIITCPIHGDFLQTPTDHLSGCGCARCKHTSSKAEQRWLSFFDDVLPLGKKQIVIANRNISPDGVDYKNKIIYEFYGDYWHGNFLKFNKFYKNPNSKKYYYELYNNTIIRQNFIKFNGWNLVCIWENNFYKFEKDLKAGIVSEISLPTYHNKL